MGNATGKCKHHWRSTVSGASDTVTSALGSSVGLFRWRFPTVHPRSLVDYIRVKFTFLLSPKSRALFFESEINVFLSFSNVP